jgi:phosphatidylserine/phosphatidylglycerophosphate/cardiolipin synthase-like enzyme
MDETKHDLTNVSQSDLKSLLRLIRSDRLTVPLEKTGLLAANLSSVVDALPTFEGLSRTGLDRLLSATIAEREARRGPELELVWTGPEAKASTTRDTYVVVHQLFEQAQHSVLVAGYAFDHGKDILEPLYRAMKERGVTAEMYLDLRERAEASDQIDAFARQKVEEFLRYNWPFGSPVPTIHYNRAALHPKAQTSTHAKCVVVDRKKVLITSANFTNRGQTRNIEAGLLVHDQSTAEQLINQWRSLLTNGGFERYD